MRTAQPTPVVGAEDEILGFERRLRALEPDPVAMVGAFPELAEEARSAPPPWVPRLCASLLAATAWAMRQRLRQRSSLNLDPDPGDLLGHVLALRARVEACASAPHDEIERARLGTAEACVGLGVVLGDEAVIEGGLRDLVTAIEHGTDASMTRDAIAFVREVAGCSPPGRGR